jgi:archaemetzincin
MPSSRQCLHEILQVEPSPFAELAGFERADVEALLAAATRSGHVPAPLVTKLPPRTLREWEVEHFSSTFPAPLVLPHDDLNYEPDEKGQTMRDWCEQRLRNRVGADGRNVLYVADVPHVATAAAKLGVDAWTTPTEAGDDELQAPRLEEMVEYLSIFYHGMTVKEMPRLNWTAWKSTARTNPVRKGVPKYIALQHGEEATRIRTRAAPDGVFKAQLNLDDILDAAIRMLPQDAYALVLLVDHDIYENEDDDFCCGRAYGGSRVAVVQSARYNPKLDVSNAIDLTHTWPTSHCKDYIDGLCAVEEMLATPPTAVQLKIAKAGRTIPMHSAMAAASTVPIPTGKSALEGLWFSRVARTASHELGHCFGMAHCVYYACNMQSTGGMKEDARQPPYFCPVCIAKLGWAICIEFKESGITEPRGVMGKKVKDWEKKRYGLMSGFCGEKGRECVAMWKGLGAWAEGVLSDRQQWEKQVQLPGRLRWVDKGFP